MSTLKKARLLYSSNQDTIMTRKELGGIATPEPRGNRHAIYRYDDFVGSIIETLELAGINITAEEYAVRKDHNQMFGILEIAGGELVEAPDFNLIMGVRGAYDQSFPRSIALGSSVMVCSNLCFSGNLGTFTTKQTTNVADRMPGLISQAVAAIPETAVIQKKRYEAYREKKITAQAGDAALVEMYRAGGLSNGNLIRAITEWKEPKHVEHTENGLSAWRLFNACTEALKPLSGNRGNMNTVARASSIVDNYISKEVVKFVR